MCNLRKIYFDDVIITFETSSLQNVYNKKIQKNCYFSAQKSKFFDRGEAYLLHTTLVKVGCITSLGKFEINKLKHNKI